MEQSQKDELVWTDGDPDADPLLLLTGFFKAIAVAVCFPTLYDLLAKVVQDLTNQILIALTDSMQTDFATIINGLSSAGIFIITLAFKLKLAV